MDRGARTVLLPGVHMEEPLFSREMPTATDEVPRQMSLPMTELPTETLPAEPNMVPPPEAGTDPSEVKLPPSPAKLGTCPKEVPSVVVPVQPVSLQTLMEQPRQPVPRGSCLIRNWQEEVSTGWGTIKGNVPQNPPHCIPPADLMKASALRQPPSL